ncbi:MAG TPA: hypothetical protein PLX97_13045, partial [Gemmatales bacterium]|nr:hypothetical protein [Gemmatales bacterium]
MGAWGAGLFQEDIACDIREAYREALEQGLSGSQATRQVLRDFREEVKDYDDGPSCWLALAATQWDLGRVEERVKQRAIKLIDNGTALKRWAQRDMSGTTPRRKAALGKLRDRLLSTPPAAKTIRVPKKTWNDSFEWPVGRIFPYTLRSGNKVLMYVIDRQGDKQVGYCPIVVFLDWIGKRLPPASKVMQCKLKEVVERHHVQGYWRVYRRVLVLSIHRDQIEEYPAEEIAWLPVQRLPQEDPQLRDLGWRDGQYCGMHGFACWKRQKKDSWRPLNDW